MVACTPWASRAAETSVTPGGCPLPCRDVAVVTVRRCSRGRFVPQHLVVGTIERAGEIRVGCQRSPSHGDRDPGVRNDRVPVLGCHGTDQPVSDVSGFLEGYSGQYDDELVTTVARSEIVTS